MSVTGKVGAILTRVWPVAWRAAVVVAVIPLLLVPAYRFLSPVSSLMVWSFVASGGAVKRTWVPLDEIAPVLPYSVIMSEDGKFCAHRGVDWQEMGKVLDRGAPRGASTVAMQTVKNLFLWNSRSYLRKLFEIPLALYADLVWGKRREMEIYLNVAEFGPGIFGAEAAAQTFFKRPAKALTANQAALLVAALPNPTGRNPARPSRNLQLLAREIAGRARQAGAYVDCLAPAGPL